MDAWETLTAGSTIDTGDAWEHLSNQGGTGTGTVDYIVLADGLQVEVAGHKTYECVTGVLPELDIVLCQPEYKIIIDQSIITVEITDGPGIN